MRRPIHALPATIGFVVIGRNEGPRLEQCLRSVLAHSDRVIYADSASTDGSPALAKRLGIRTVILDSSSPTSAARGRNAGFRLLRQCFPACDYVQFVDGDCIVEANWPSEAARFLQDSPRVAAACGRRFEAKPRDSFYNWLMDREWQTPVGEAGACGGDTMMRIEAFEQVGGFRDDLAAGEEPELCARLRAAGWTIWRLDERMTEHDANIHRLSQWWNRARRSGYGYAQVWTVTRALPQRLYGHLLSRVFLWALLVPLVGLLAAWFAGSGWLLGLVPLVYGLQIARMAIRDGWNSARSWRAASLMLLMKVPEAIGALSYFVAGNKGRSFDYKRNAGFGSEAR